MIDLRSDTVTLPTEAMLERMRRAPLGDDGLDGDPTVGELEAAAAALLGKEACLYVPTATMGNLLAILTACQPGSRALLPATSHMATSEAGAADLARVVFEPIAEDGGAIQVDVLERSLARPAARVALVGMETSHAAAGGTVLPLGHMAEVASLASSHEARTHVDGARLWNAAIALGVPPAMVAASADSAVLCLSKGLSAPVGAVVVSDDRFVRAARRIRKTVGGTQRQAGVVAAAGLVAIESMIERLADDHARARLLADSLTRVESSAFAVSSPATNIILVDLSDGAPDSNWWATRLCKLGVAVRPRGPRQLRLVVHRHHDDADVEAAVAAFQTIVGTLDGTTNASSP